MKKYGLELLMACLLLVSFLILSKQAAQVAGTMATTDNSKTILVDAGHGGADPGMIGVGGLEEKGINLQIAMKLREILEKKGFTVIMTREEDKGLYDEESRNQKAQDMQCRIAMIKKYRKSLAELIQEKLNTRLDVKRPRVAKGNKTYYLLKRSESVLNIVECGFLTNPQEAELLQTDEYQLKVADAISEGIDAYFSKNK